MRALILNSGLGSRMGDLTKEHPKCMTPVSPNETILNLQLRMLCEAGITEAVMTTGAFDSVLVSECSRLDLPLRIIFVKNPDYAQTNYIYSIYCAREALRGQDILLMHGDLVFENTVLDDLLACETSCMAVSSAVPLPEKDFKAVTAGGMVQKVGIEFFTDAVAAQPLYKLRKDDWDRWLDAIIAYCESGDPAKRRCYAENALNELPEKQIAAELIREKALKLLEKEIPHGLAVVIDSFKEREDKDLIDIDATIICEKASHKPIIIGKGGAMIKKIGSYAREDMEKMLETKVNLQLFVKIKERWRDSDYLIKNFGFDKKELE